MAMQYNKVCILGGSGFVGTHLISQLGAAGKSIKVLTRRKERCKHLSVLPDIEIVEANVHDQHVLNEQFKDMDAVINLVGILNEREHNGDGCEYIPGLCCYPGYLLPYPHCSMDIILI